MPTRNRLENVTVVTASVNLATSPPVDTITAHRLAGRETILAGMETAITTMRKVVAKRINPDENEPTVANVSAERTSTPVAGAAAAATVIKPSETLIIAATSEESEASTVEIAPITVSGTRLDPQLTSTHRPALANLLPSSRQLNRVPIRLAVAALQVD